MTKKWVLLVCTSVVLGRSLLFSASWVGQSVGLNLWSNNSNWQFNMGPVSGGSVEFPSFMVTNFNSNEDFVNFSVSMITMMLPNTGQYAIGPFSGGTLVIVAPGTFNFNNGINTTVPDSVFNVPTEISSGVTLTFSTSGAGTNHLRYGGFLMGDGGVSVSGTFLTFTDLTNTFSAGLTLAANAILKSEATGTNNPFGSGQVTLGSGSTIWALNTNTLSSVPFSVATSVFQVGSGAVLTLGGVVSGTNFTVQGGGTLNLQNTSNTHTGTITIASGSTLQGDAAAIQGDPMNPCNLNNSGAVILDVATGNTTTFGGVISNSGAVTKTGDGTLVLSNTNTYTGSTTISAGILTVNGGFSVSSSNFTVDSGAVFTLGGVVSGTDFTVQGGGTLNLQNTSNTQTGTITIVSGTTLQGDAAAVQGDPTNPCNLDNSGAVTLDVSTGNTTTFGGVISNSGTVTKTGAGHLILSNTNTYTGDTTVSGGTLTANGGFSVSSSNFTVDSGAVFTLGGVVSGTDFTVQGGGILTLQNTSNTQTGTITVASGTTLQGDAAAVQGDPTNPCNLDNSGVVTLDVSTGNTTTFGGVISNSGTVTKTGEGSLVLANTNTYTGETTINGGVLAVNGSITSAVTVNSGATLQGSETLPDLPALITGNVSVGSGGTLAPGNSIGTINVAGLVTFGAGSVFEVELNPTSADKLVVTGSGGVSILPTAILSLEPDAAVYTAPLQFLIIDATGAAGEISGEFLTIQNSYPLFSPTIVQTAQTLSLVLTVAPLHTLVSTGNAGAAARCLASATPASGSDLDFIIGNLTVVTSQEELHTALTVMQPSQFTAFSVIQQELSMQIGSKVRDKIYRTAWKCPTGKKASGEVWFDFLGDLSIQSKTRSGEPGYIARSGATLMGYQYTLPEHGIVGVCGSYSFTGFNWKMGRGHGQIQSYYGMAYGSFSTPHFLLTGMVLGAYNHYQGTRNIKESFIPLDRKASHTHRGYELGANITVATPMNYHSWTFTPFISSDALYLHQASIREHGAESLDLNIHAINSQYYREEAGLDIQKCYLFDNMKWLGSVQLSYIREFRPKGQHLKAQFRGVDCTYEVTGFYPGRNLFSPSATLEVATLKDSLSISLTYNGLFGTHFWDQDLNLNLGYKF